MKGDKVKIVKLTTIITMIIMFICIIVLTCQFVKIGNYRKQTHNLETEKQTLIEEIYNFNTSNSYYDNNRSEYLEEYARENLTWSQPGETWYTKD